jgi:hypothetical protein
MLIASSPIWPAGPLAGSDRPHGRLGRKVRSSADHLTPDPAPQRAARRLAAPVEVRAAQPPITVLLYQAQDQQVQHALHG